MGLYDSRREAPLHMVVSVSLRTDMLTRSFGYGDVIIRTFTGQLTFRNVGNPKAMAALIEEHWRRVQHQRQQTERATLAQTLQDKVGVDTPALNTTSLPVTSERASRDVGLDHWTLQLRFEDKGVITYRKHWAVLLQAIALPSILLLAGAGLLGGSLSGMVQLLDPLLSAVILVGWRAASAHRADFAGIHGRVLQHARVLPRRPDRVVRAARWAFLLLAFPVPGWLLGWGGGSVAAYLCAFAVQFAGLLAERWLFFAEARHPQNLYYQAMA